ncbi:E3 ubiquitin-protein ligase TRIM33-like [Littorina saxatilis]|uniref:E3 ubiquitin-protein ligase TRIM33-like n=1 Tax=Littorina saxatilis TaxID=31220 RepID=UPI0038B51B2D
MATAAPPVPEPDDMDCSVCHEQYVQPKLLPCGHLLCHHCLLSWLQSQDQALCPLCRCAIVDPEERGQKSVQDVADGFPTDLAMADLVEAHRLLKQSHSCICEDAAATCLCLTCGDLFCESCRKIHLKMKVTRNHTVEDLTSLTADKVAGSQHAACAVHADKTTELFCPTHGESICHLCATSRHRCCPEVKDMEEKVKDARAVLAKLAVTLTEGEARLDKAIQQLDAHLTETEKQTKKAVAEIEAVCARLEKSVQDCRHRLNELAHSACSDVKEAVTETKTCLLQRRGKLTSHKHVVQRVQEAKNRDTVSTMTPVMQTRVGNLDCSATLPSGAKVVSKVTVVIDAEAVTRIEKELSGLGQAKVMSADLDIGLVPVLSFHDNHGKNIVLSNNKQTAERRGRGWDGGIVVASQPMVTNMLYEVIVDKRDALWRGWIWTGATTTPPDALTLPPHANGWPSAVVISNNSVNVNGGHTLDTNVGQKLLNVPEKSRVGVMLDKKRSLHLYINGDDQGEAAPSLPDPCFAFFDLWGPYRHITALPVRRIQ